MTATELGWLKARNGVNAARPEAGGTCVIDEKASNSVYSLHLLAPDGSPTVTMLGHLRVLQLRFDANRKRPTALLESRSFVFYGDVDETTLMLSYRGPLIKNGPLYRSSLALVPESADAAGSIALRDQGPGPGYPWTPVKAAPVETLRVPCADLTFAQRPMLEGRTSLGYGTFTESTVAISPSKDSRPVGTLKTVGSMGIGLGANLLEQDAARSEIDVNIDNGFHAIGWVSNAKFRLLRKNGMTASARLSVLYPDEPMAEGFALLGIEHGEPAAASYRKCQSALPIWGDSASADEPGGIVQFGYVKAGRVFSGSLDSRGDFRIDLLGFEAAKRSSTRFGSDSLFGSDDRRTKRAPKVPFIPKDALAGAHCETLTQADYQKQISQP